MTFSNLQIRDPFIFKENNLFYVTGTSNDNSFKIFISPDLKNIVSIKTILNLKTEGIESECAWAPEIHNYNGKYYLIITLKENGKHRGSYVAISDKIDGKYRLVSQKPITPIDQDCLDATLFVDNNIPYIIYCHEWLQVKNGEIWIAELSKDLTKVVGTPKLLFTAKDAKWTSPVEKDCYVTDGPFVLKYKDHYCMLWSSFYEGKYALSIIKSKSLFSGWIQEEKPTFKDDEGHGMIFRNNNDLFIAMHHSNTHPNERLKIIKIEQDILKNKDIIK